MFKNSSGNKCKQGNFEETFFELLEEVQEKTKLICDAVDVRQEYGIIRSMCRGSNTHARNMEVSEPRLELNNR